MPSTCNCEIIRSAVQSWLLILSTSTVAVVISDVSTLHGVAGKDERDNETIQTESLGEDKNQDDSDKELGLTSIGTNTSITNDADSDSSGETSHATAETS